MTENNNNNGIRTDYTDGTMPGTRPVLKSIIKLNLDDCISSESSDPLLSDLESPTKLFPSATSSRKIYTDFPAHDLAKTGKVDELRQVLNSPKINLFRQDYVNKRTVLHYAASFECIKTLNPFQRAGIQEVSLKMTKLILASNYFKRNEHEEKHRLINIQDKQQETCLHLAAKKRHRKVVEYLLLSGADVNLKSTEDKEPIELIYEHVPQVMLAVFDQNISSYNGDIYEDNFEALFNFGAIIGYPDEEETAKNLDGDTECESKLLVNALNGNEKKCGEILVHPLVQIFLREKWRKIRILFLASILFHMAWLVLYTVFILNLYVYKCPYLSHQDGTEGGNDTNSTRSGNGASIVENVTDFQCSATSLGTVNTISLVSTILFTVIVGLKELYEMLSLPTIRIYFTNLENIGQITQIVLIAITTWPALFAFVGSASASLSISSCHYQTAAFGVLLAWTLILSQIGKFPQLGIYVDILHKVLRSFGMFMITFVSLLAGFAFSFSILMPRSEMFRPHLAFPTMLSMMVGELNYQETFFSHENPEDHSVLPFPVSGHILFAAFTIIVTIILFNLLIGFTVSDIQGLQNRAHVSRLSNQLEQIYLMEKFLFSKNMQKLTRFLKLHKTFQQKFLIVPPSPPSQFFNKIKTRVKENLKARFTNNSNTSEITTVSGSSENVETSSMRERDFKDSSVVRIIPRGSIDEIEAIRLKKSEEVVIPIKGIPKTLVNEVRKLAAINKNPKPSSSEDEVLASNVLSEIEEMQSQYRKVMEKLDLILSRLQNPTE